MRTDHAVEWWDEHWIHDASSASCRERLMFSSRLPWDLRPNRLSLALQACRRPARPSSTSRIQPTRAGFSYRASNLERSRVRSLFYEPSRRLRRGASGVAGYYRARGHQVEPERIIVTARPANPTPSCSMLADPAMRCWFPVLLPALRVLAALESVRPCIPARVHGAWLWIRCTRAQLNPRTRASSWSIEQPHGLVSQARRAGAPDRARRSARLDECLPTTSCALIRIVPTLVDVQERSPSAERPVEGAGLPQMKLGDVAPGAPRKLSNASS